MATIAQVQVNCSSRTWRQPALVNRDLGPFWMPYRLAQSAVHLDQPSVKASCRCQYGRMSENFEIMILANYQSVVQPTWLRRGFLNGQGQGLPAPLSFSGSLRRPIFWTVRATADELTATAVEAGTELKDAEDFGRLADRDGLISIVGFGSLLSLRSARFTFPDLQTFRLARLDGFRRVFAHVAPVFLTRGIANVETREMSSLSVEPCEGESILVTMFEIDVSEAPAFIEREHEFRFLTVYPTSTTSSQGTSRPAVVCSRYSDEEYRRIRCKGSELEFEQRYGQYGVQQIWVDDVLPCRTYLRHCVLAAQNLSEEAYTSFLDHTYLADRRTTIRQHLDANPQIMLELPPPELAERYGG